MTSPPMKAAQYVRMSTEDQVYSTANQIDAITRYAGRHHFEIIRTYADEGRSGVQLKGRPALQEMLRDVLSGDPGYQAILVFDVSRWGRFQDSDESAHYEFICRRAGVHIHYCAESFLNDGSVASAIMKNVRRIMAGEFSRDLSAKTWAGQSRLVSLGYRMGGKAGYGLRRLLIDRDGVPKQILEEGQHKSITTDRVILVPGPPEEVAVIRRIFDLAKAGENYQKIADALNADGVAAPLVAQWCNGSIRAIVKAERYMGVNIYNKRSMRLGSPFVYNPESEWVRCEGAFEPIVSAETFYAVQAQDRYRRPSYTDDQLLTHLQRVFDEHGYLSKDLIIAAAPPTAKTYRERFGGLRSAYLRVGYDPWTRDRYRGLGPLVDSFIDETRKALEIGRHRVSPTMISRLLTVDGRIVIAPRLYQLHSSGLWRLKFSPSPDVDLVLAGLMDGDTRKSMYLIPVRKFAKSRTINIKPDGRSLETFKLWDFSWLSEMISWIIP
ncbi:hypothetical protein ASE00_12605 [Sphingomonas sp. Root710]|uniref:recombinase family protein n=1 Tax=Sphingomonas sp. Root710 TaxID=1736594 RepID=UPI0006FC40FF|nr:recombinase family protein [Sphingomonas sp. Root710]KRB82852.1 hypothetical protein ASE00_12605 [Sphingomonas sp. Root710]